MKGHAPRHLDAGRHVGEAEGNRLVFGDRLAKSHPLAGIVARRLECRPRHADGLSGDADTTLHQVGEGDAISVAHRPQNIFDRDHQVLEGDLAGVAGAMSELFLEAHDPIAGIGRRGQEACDAPFAGRRVGEGDDHRDIGALARSDELLDAVEHVGLAAPFGDGLQVGGVRARLGFGEQEGAALFARCQGSEEALFLVVGAEIEQRCRDRRIARTHDVAEAAVGGRDLFDRDHVGREIQAGAAPFFGHAHAHQAEAPHGVEGVDRDVAVAIPAGGMGDDLRLCEAAHHVADRFLFGRQGHRVSGLGPGLRSACCRRSGRLAGAASGRALPATPRFDVPPVPPHRGRHRHRHRRPGSRE